MERGSQAGTKTKQEQKMRAIERFVRISRILEQPGAGGETEKGIMAALKDMPPEERALRIYESIVTYSLERHAEKDKPVEEKAAPAPDPYFISEFKQLWSDEEARGIFLEKFGETQADLATHQLSELGKNLKEIEGSLRNIRGEYAENMQDLNLQRVKTPTAIKATKAKLGYQRRRMEELSNDERKIVGLEGFERTAENTDVAALEMYETLRRYQKEAEEGFAWLPSRRKIHEKISEAIEHTGKAPLLIGPPGTGKTTQIDAAARERTGADAIRIPCHAGLSEEGLVYIRDIKAGEGAYDYKGTVTEAATGYEHSLAKAPGTSFGRVASLDEISQLNIDRALGPVKDIRQAKIGKKFSRFAPHEVLPGFQLAATSNTPISDERLDREFARIPTNYFEMTPENPELYEFMLAKLLRKEGHLPLIDKRDIAPAYQKQDLPEGERTKLADGGTVVAKDMLITDPAAVSHGFLYRFAGAIRAMQDSYIHGSKFNEKHLANTAVYEDTQDDKIVIKGYVDDLADKSKLPGGKMLKLKSGSSTITAEMVSRWMDGFTESGKKDLTKWLQRLLQEHIDQTGAEDAERIAAIAGYFHLFDEVEKRSSAKPLTPKEIGYLSPRVPRPVYVEKPQEAETAEEKKPIGEIKEYDTTEVVLASGERVLIKKDKFEGQTALSEKFNIAPGQLFRIDEENFSFVGAVEGSGDNKGKLAASLVNEKELHQLFEANEVEVGILNEGLYETGEDLKLFCPAEDEAQQV